jgi:hypothetical protein
MPPWSIDFAGRLDEPEASLAMPLGGRAGFAGAAG